MSSASKVRAELAKAAAADSSQSTLSGIIRAAPVTGHIERALGGSEVTAEQASATAHETGSAAPPPAQSSAASRKVEERELFGSESDSCPPACRRVRGPPPPADAAANADIDGVIDADAYADGAHTGDAEHDAAADGTPDGDAELGYANGHHDADADSEREESIVPVAAAKDDGVRTGWFALAPFVSEQARCRICLLPIEDVTRRGVRVVKKTPPTFQCPQCCVKIVSLTKLHGRWPVPEFEGLSEAMKVKFFAETGSSMTDLKAATVDLIVKNRVETHGGGIKGTFKPLSVYARDGYDIQMIKDNSAPEDRETHPVLGETFRVHLKSSNHKQEERELRQQVLQTLKRGQKAISVPPAEVLGEAVPIDDGDGEAAPTDDDSASDSSRGSRKKAKKDKKAKKKAAKKAAKAKKSKSSKKNRKRSSSSSSSSSSSEDPKAALEAEKKRKREEEKHNKDVLRKNAMAIKAAEALAKRARSKAVSDATKVIAKTVTPLTTLGTALHCPDAKKVPASTVKAANAAYKHLENMRHVADEVTRDPTTTSIPFSFDEVKAAVDEAQNQTKALTGLFAAVRRFVG